MLSFKDLFKSYGPEVYRFALWISGDSIEAEDITSETIIRAWVRHKKIRTETLKAYLFTIARNIYLEHLRKKKRQVGLEDIYPDPAPGPDKQTESNHTLQKIQSVLKTLPEIDRTAFVMRVQHELPYEEISRALELSLTSARVKVYRVRKKMIALCMDKEVN